MGRTCPDGGPCPGTEAHVVPRARRRARRPARRRRRPPHRFPVARFMRRL